MKKVVIKEFEEKKLKNLLDKGIDPLIAKLLFERGFETFDEARLYLEGGFADLHDPGLIKNIDKATEIISQVVDDEGRICIFGDYDADGVTSTAIMVLTLEDLQANVFYRMPDRLSEGYGMSISAVKEIHEKGCDLIITVDNGIRCHEEIALAKKLGMKVVVLDHHIPSETLPDADAIVDLHVEGETYPYIELAGCGLAFKVSCYLYEEFGFGLEEGYKNIDIAAIGTVADVVSLTGENRIIVKEGINFLNDPFYDRPGIAALMDALRVERGTLTSMDIGFRLAPALNAPGRLLEMGADKALELLLCDDEFEASKLAEALQGINEIRKNVTVEYTEQADKYVEEHLKDDKVLVLFIPDIPEGVVGLVSGRLTEKYNRPSIVFSEGDEYYKASGRSIEAFNLYEALCACDDLLFKYGGHEQAAGMSVEKNEKTIDDLRVRINNYADTVLTEEDLEKTIYVDKKIKSEDISFDLYDKLSVMEPFGQHNPKPVFYTESFQTVKKNKSGVWLPYLYMGEGKNHLKLFGERADILAFGMVPRYEECGRPKRLDIAFTLGVNNFMGRQYLQMEALDFAPSVEEDEIGTGLMESMADALGGLGITIA